MLQQLQPLEEVKIGGLTRTDIQEIFAREFAKVGYTGGNIVFTFDVSYMMNFHDSDFENYIKKMTWATRYDIGLMRDWHRQCERWFLDQTVRNERGDWLKPIHIARSVDKVPNEGLQVIAATILGIAASMFKFDEIGTGTGGVAYPSDFALEVPRDRIDILIDSPGGSVNIDGSTVYWVGNHLKTVPSYNFTEGGIFNTNSALTDLCMNHSYFPGYVIPHLQGIDTINRTTILYMCSV